MEITLRWTPTLGTDALSSAVVFAQVADRLSGTPVEDVLREFGWRRDVTLADFGWELIQTEAGPDFVPRSVCGVLLRRRYAPDVAC